VSKEEHTRLFWKVVAIKDDIDVVSYALGNAPDGHMESMAKVDLHNAKVELNNALAKVRFLIDTVPGSHESVAHTNFCGQHQADGCDGSSPTDTILQGVWMCRDCAEWFQARESVDAVYVGRFDDPGDDYY